MSEFPVYAVELETRQEGDGRRRIRGSFPYAGMATIADRGRTRKERIRAGAFRYALENPESEISLLRGHNFDMPLASWRGRTLELRDTSDALYIEAVLPPDAEQPSWVRDTVRAIDAGLMLGLSPGFRVPPASAVPNAEELVPEPDNPGVMIRQINHAVLFELSVVTRAAYRAARVELRHGGADRRWLLTL